MPIICLLCKALITNNRANILKLYILKNLEKMTGWGRGGGGGIKE
jgi:hypothetical protein